MTDEIRIYHVDDPNDAPDRRLGAFPTINPILPIPSLDQYVIEPVANSLYTAMQYYWYSAYQQGIAAQRQHQQQQQQLQLQLHQHQNHHQQHHHLQQQQQQQQRQEQQQQQSAQQSHQAAPVAADPSLAAATNTSSTTAAPTTPNPTHHHLLTTTNHLQEHHHQHQLHELKLEQRLTSHDQDSQPLSAGSTAQLASSSSSSSSSTSSSPPSHHSHHHHHNDDSGLNHLQNNNHHRSQSVSSVEQEQPRKQEHIKKPLNPFMIFMQKQRPEIVRQGIIKESAAINQLLGQQWRKLSREEQEPYYKLAEQEKILHAQKYPGWSARDNYANQKKRKKLKLKSISLNGMDQSDKKCRARFGLGNMASWCKPCKRKKKCIYSMPRHHHRDSNSSSNNHHHHHHHGNHHHPHNPHHHLHHNPFHPHHPHHPTNHHSHNLSPWVNS